MIKSHKNRAAQIFNDLLHFGFRVVGLILEVGHTTGEFRAFRPQLFNRLVLQFPLAQLVVLTCVLQVVHH